MNFLAHLALSGHDELLLIGNFMADYTKGKQAENLPPGVQRGLELHRLIDSFTDAHPAVREMNARLRPYHGHYAPVVSDILFDYILYCNWERYMPENFDSFKIDVYTKLRRNLALFSPRLAERVRGMTGADWLETYTSAAGMADVFRRLLPRLSRPELLAGVGETLSREFAALDAAFGVFYPDLVAEVEGFLGNRLTHSPRNPAQNDPGN